MKKKSYNPFRMWGSYLGAGLGLFYSVVNNLAVEIWNARYASGNIHIGADGLDYLWQSNNLIFIIVGFLIGWGIHSLIRRLR